MNIVDNRTIRAVRPRRSGLAAGVPAVALLALATTFLAGCSAARPASRLAVGTPSAADVSLVRFNSCADALRNLRAAASRAIGAGGFAVGSGTSAPGTAATAGAPGAPGTGRAPSAQTAPQLSTGSAASDQAGAASGAYSSTNTATIGVDEPDIVKTDGRRVVTITGDVLRVVDAQTRQITGVLDLSSGPDFGAPDFSALTPANVLLAGNHALVLFSPYPYAIEGSPAGAGTAGPPTYESTATDARVLGPRLALVDLSAGTPQIISEYTMDGTLVDARQVGSVARVVIQSAPRIYGPPMRAPSTPGGLATNRASIAHATVSQWLPRYAVTTGGRRHTGLVDCASVSHPATTAYTGSSMLTVLTFDLSGTSLGDGEPVTIVADGDTVYSDGASLYIASRGWIAPPMTGTSAASAATATAGPPTIAEPVVVAQYTGLYKFDISGPGRPVYEASGTVPGWLLGSSGTAEYALSAWNGALRVATTTEGAVSTGTVSAGTGLSSQSAVYVLEQAGDQLVVVGKAGGLGAGEQIYSVRFAGAVGYVATFRQTDPLYTLDLSDPAQPRVVGQLLLSGYSSFLYPVDATHLIGIGQDANALGQTTGTQISLFDVSDLAAPVRLAVYDVQFGHSEAEFDPHAFLYWPSSRLLVVPVQLPYGPTPGPTPVPQGGTVSGGTGSGGTGGTAQDGGVAYWPLSEAMVLHVGDGGFTLLGAITHPGAPGYSYGGQIRRSLIAGNALWTLSDAGLKASDIATLAPLGWVPFPPGQPVPVSPSQAQASSPRGAS
jgi:hypothetical protein